MKRALPAWLLAALPATLIGHAAAYRIAGESMADGRHAYFGPMFEYSLGLLLALGVGAIVAALLRSGRVGMEFDRSLGDTWLKLAAAQTLLFALLEHLEGYMPSLAGCLTQVVIALFVAFALIAFGRLIERCIAVAEASIYRTRLRDAIVGTLYVAHFAPSDALCVCLGTRRFQRPPPFS